MSSKPAAHRLTAERVKLLAGAARIVSASAKPQMKVPFLDLKAHHAPMIGQFDRAIRKVIESSAFAGGPFVEEFEEEFAAYCGSLYAIGVGNGTDALWLTLLALGIGPGDEVITVPNTFFATVEAITYCKAQPVFVDVDENTFTMDPAELENSLTARTKAIIPVHLSGNRLTWIRFWNSRGHTGFLSLKMRLKLTALSTRAEKQALWATPVASASIPGKILALLVRPARS